ncbi:ATP-binding protein [Streptomyces yaizuensis]|uniref:LuxR C-terminal-related transcriptional regulator n=1 Tax=Streptomyces yaizuensis TaxID=2989713 RepID=A0ABQ5PA17_9ACTN|nr:LuxR C-terminal-related transcriptional regulator [Streptomyces sp. YSPA8]GLF99417.1 LuxR C-terminal-related transcriptional regulator [Streptomyces sp. YSPA8]
MFDDAIGEFTHGGRHLDIDEWCDRGDVTETLLAVLGLGVSLDPREARERLTGHLRTRHFLLALDGCHHRRAHLTPLISHLVKECPGLTVLVTGPDRLGVYGEVLLRLDPLAVPRADDTYTIATLQRIPSVRLFVQRTRMVRPRFVLTDDNLDAVARLCVRTDGLPMAVEFAAARMKLLSPQRLLTELDEGLDSLSGAEFDTLTQHSGMPAALDHGLLGLTPGERSFLDRLALFHNEFEFSAAQGVSATPPGETHRLLEILVDKSLLRTRECPDGDVLITMLGLTRQHLVERMRADGTLTAVEREHATYCLKLAEESENGLRGSSQGRWLQQIDHWLPDITAALAHLAAAGDRERIVRIASALRLYWQARGTVYDGIAWLSGHENAGLPPEVAAKGERALAELLLCGGELSAAGERLARARALYEHLEDGSGIAGCLRRAGLIAYYRGDLVEAERRFDECVSLDRVDDAGEHAEALRNLADCRRVAGDPLSARSLAEESLRLFERAGDVRNIALTDYVRADIAFALGEQETAAELYQSALLRVAALKHTAATAIGLEKFAILLTRSRGRATESWRRAARSFGAAARIRAAAGCVAPATTKMEVDSVVATTRVRLGDQEALELAAAGARMEPDVAIAAALTPLDIARTARDGIDRDNPLTQREQEVAELVAAGLTNREIARRLGIAEWTAVNHLRKIMRKLSCSSRVQVASWVANRAEAVAVAE